MKDHQSLRDDKQIVRLVAGDEEHISINKRQGRRHIEELMWICQRFRDREGGSYKKNRVKSTTYETETGWSQKPKEKYNLKLSKKNKYQ